MVKESTVNQLRYNLPTKQAAQYLLKIGSKSDCLLHSLYCGSLQKSPGIYQYGSMGKAGYKSKGINH